MKGYFGIGIDRVTKPRNVGALFRTAHAFGAGFVFSLGATYERQAAARSDTSDAMGQMPYYNFPDADALILPEGCKLVGIELMDDAVALPSFRHPRQAAYVLGPERGALSDDLVARCDHLIQIPTQFCINVGLAGAVVMYDRLISQARYPGRPLMPGGEPIALEDHVHGGPVLRRKIAAARDEPPGLDDDDEKTLP